MLSPEGPRLGSSSGYKTRGSLDNDNKYVKFRIHYLQLILNATDTMSSETESGRARFRADSLENGPKLFSPTHKIILFLVARYPQSSQLSIYSVTKGPALGSLCGKYTRYISEVSKRCPSGTGCDLLVTNLKLGREEAIVFLKTQLTGPITTQ